MSTVDIAVITYGREDLIVALLPNRFEQHTADEKNEILYAVNRAAKSEKLYGRMIAIWEDNSGERKTLSAPDLNPLCYLLSMRWVKRQLCVRLEIE